MMAWKKFWAMTMGGALGLGGILFAAVVVVDPYDSLFISPPLARVPITQNQRFSYPALARSSGFDSAVIGTSTSRLLRPDKLGESLGGGFVNLSMNSATAYEQSRIFALFARHHPRPATVVFAIDVVWCVEGKTPAKFTERPFPPWLYDDNPWNDLLHLFNFPTLEETGRLIAYFLGLRAPRQGLDGYRNFLPPESEYDLEKVQRGIYGDQGPRPRRLEGEPVDIAAALRAGWNFPTHDLLRGMLSALPEETVKIILFVPYHHFLQPPPGSRGAAIWRECKRRLTAMAGAFTNSHVLDFMTPSKITLADENYWDVLHYNRATADRIVELIAQGVRQGRGEPGYFDYLGP